jgi:Fe-S-cluster-containing dehydrogenase component
MPADMEFFVDPHRCIGCHACEHACAECETHKGHSMIHIEYVERSTSVQTVPVVCMHCHSPTCADVCPADAIKRSADGRVMTARKPRCIACSNCVLACPFGVPKMMTDLDLMMKCDMCFDRTSTGRKPMCATVCPSEALFFGTREEVELRRRRSRPVNEFRFGGQVVATKVNMMVPLGRPAAHLDVTAALHEKPAGGLISLNVLTDAPVPLEDAS